MSLLSTFLNYDRKLRVVLSRLHGGSDRWDTLWKSGQGALHLNDRFSSRVHVAAVWICMVSSIWGLIAFVPRPVLFLREKTDLPAWMIPVQGVSADGCIFQYGDIIGRSWFRLMQSRSDTNGYFWIDPRHFPEGCRIVWFSHDKNILSVHAGHPIDRIGGSGGYLGSQYPRRITVEEVTPWTLSQGLRLGVLDSSRRSVYVRIEPARITNDSWHRPGDPPLGTRMWMLGMVVWCGLAWAGLLILYRRTGAFKFAVAALCAAFWLAGIVFDRPFSGFGGQIDAGDDSYYTAYAQNLITKSGLFHKPTRIGFGAGHVKHMHGLPGAGLFLAPAPVLESLLSGQAIRREIDLNGLRAMRLLSAGYSLLAMILLCRSFHLVGSSGWNVGFPTLLLWGTTLPKWTFQRCIFTHSVEMFLLCGILLCMVHVYKRPARMVAKGCLLAILVGACSWCGANTCWRASSFHCCLWAKWGQTGAIWVCSWRHISR